MPSNPDLAARLERDFTYHPPTEETKEKYVAVRTAAKAFAETLIILAPPSRELSLAITNLEQVVFWANAAIARNS